MISTKSGSQFQALREGGQINAFIHQLLARSLVPGVTARELNETALRELHALGAEASFPRETDFPGAICVSVGPEVGHGVPDDKTIHDGDLVKLDLGVYYRGMHTDAATTHVVGTPSSVATKLRESAERALWRGIGEATAGRRISNVSAAIYDSVREDGFHPIRTAFGHGIGEMLHEDPQIANFGPPDHGVRLSHGMVLAIEPVISAGRGYTKARKDGWTTVTTDGKLAAHAEHTILVTEAGVEVLTELHNEGVKPRLIGSRQSLGNSNWGEGCNLREFVESDRNAVVALAHLTMDPVLMAAWGRRVQARELFVSGTRTLVLDCSGKVAAFLTYRIGETLYVNTIAVHPRWQSNGFGGKLMRVAEDLARQYHRSIVELSVQVTNPRAIAFYDRLGFQTVGKPLRNTLLMRKYL